MTPFRIAVPESDLEDLRHRLARTRWPEAETVGDWSQGVPLAYLRDLCRHWADGYDWRRVEARLNAWPQVVVEVDGLAVHALVARSPHPGALPLVLTHGWPGGVVEFLDVLGPLTDPPAHGGDPADAFHVVCPSLPGYGFSAKPAAPGWGVERIADAWAELMGRLGHERFGAAGSDWGTSVSTLLALRHPGRLAGIHLVPPLAAPAPGEGAGAPTVGEAAALADLARRGRDGSAYSEVHATRPQTVGYGLVDSPVALCAWMAEKLVTWADNPGAGDGGAGDGGAGEGGAGEGGDPDHRPGTPALGPDQVLDLVTLYWLTATGASSARLYWESIRLVSGWFTDPGAAPVDVPTGCSTFPREVPRVSRRWAERRFRRIVHWGEPPRGGHFAAYEQPALFVDELRASFRHMR